MYNLRSSSTVVRLARRAGLSVVLLLTAGIGQSLAADLRVPVEYSTIQAAIDAAAPGDTVLVADGVYSGPGNTFLDFWGKNITVRSEGGADGCIIDGEGVAPGFLFHSYETSEAVVDGFTVRRGNYDVASGVAIMESSPTIKNCVFENNKGIGGGAVFAAFGNPTFTNCAFTGNTGVQGGAVYSVYADTTFTNCTFTGNSAFQGGALFVSGRSITVVNGIVANNLASDLGGAVYAESAFVNVAHGTLVGNVSGVGGGVYSYGGFSNFINSILWNNGVPPVDGYTEISYSLVEGGFPGVGNIGGNPRFVGADDLRLLPGSCAVDAGTADTYLLPATDLAGNERVLGAAPDMGAYELAAATEVPDTTAPVIENVSVTPDVLTAPNHKMRNVTVSYTVTDDRDSAPTYSLSVVSNEPDNGLGDGDTANDIEVLSAHELRLRAERSGKGTGRVYTITITATDAAGNTATKEVTVTVPKGK